MLHPRVVIAAWSIGVLFSTLLSLALGELTIRAIHVLRDGIPFSEAPSGRVGAIVLDPGLGGAPRRTMNRICSILPTVASCIGCTGRRASRGFVPTAMSRHEGRGSSSLGTPLRRLRRSPMTKTYHALLRKKLGLEVFAYGAGGYGTLQEYLILDEVVDHIGPTMLLWAVLQQ